MGREWFSKQTLGSLVDERARRHGGREALVFQGRRWTFAELAADVDRVARGLIGLGVEPGDKVALWMMNRPEWIHAALAAIRIGAVLVPINTRFRTEDAAYVLGQSDSTTLIIAARSGPIDYLGMARELLPSLTRTGVAGRDARLPAMRRVIALGDEEARRPEGGLDQHVGEGEARSGPEGEARCAPEGEARCRPISWPALLAAGAGVSEAALRARVDAVDPDATA